MWRLISVLVVVINLLIGCGSGTSSSGVAPQPTATPSLASASSTPAAATPSVGNVAVDLQFNTSRQADRATQAANSLPLQATTILVHLVDASSGADVVGSPQTLQHTAGDPDALTVTFAAAAGTYTIFIEADDLNGNLLGVFNQSVSVTSGQTSTITVDSTLTVTSLQIFPSSPTVVSGATLQLQATALFSNGSTLNATSLATWNSSAPSDATVNEAGLVSGLLPATSTLSVTLAGVSGSASLTVQASSSATPTPTATPTPSPTPLTVSAVTSNTTQTLNGCFGGSAEFVAVGNAAPATLNSTILVSGNGTQWSNFNPPVQGTLLAVGSATFNGVGSFVAVGPNGTIMTSPDGETWTPRTSGTTATLHAVASANGTCAVVGVNDTGSQTQFGGIVVTSSDGVNWSPQFVAPQLFGITIGLGQFVAVGTDPNVATSPASVVTSSNASTWTTNDIVSAPGTTLNAIGVGNGMFVAVGTASAGAAILTSGNLSDWAPQSAGVSTDSLNGVAFGDGVFAVSGASTVGNGGVLLNSSDGMNWASQNTATRLFDVSSGGATGSQLFVAVGLNGTILAASP